MLIIGIIGGLSTIDWLFNGNFAFWGFWVICFIGIGIILLFLAQRDNQVKSHKEILKVQYSNKPASQKLKSSDSYLHLKYHTIVVINSIKEHASKIDHLYIKIILTTIVVLLLIITIELNDKLS